MNNIVKKIIPYLKHQNSKNFLIVVITKYMKQGFMFGLGILLPIYLSINDYGIYSTMQLFITFSVFLNLGSVNALNKELSINKNEQKYQEIIILNASLIMALVTMLIVVFGYVTFNTRVNVFDGAYIYIIGILVFLQVIYMLENVFRAYEEYKPLFYSTVMFVTIGVLSVIFFILYEESNYFVIGNIIVLVCLTHLSKAFVLFVYYAKKKKCEFKIENFDRRIIKRLLTNGVSLLLIQSGYVLFVNSDRLIVSLIGGTEKLAYYNFAVSVVLGASLLTQSINYILYPRLLYRFNKKTREFLEAYVRRILPRIVIGLMVFDVFFLSVLYIFVKTILSQFLVVFGIIVILILSSIFNVISSFLNVLSVAKDQELFILKNQLASIVLNICISSTVMLLGADMIFVAVGTAVSQIVYFLVSYLNYRKILESIE